MTGSIRQVSPGARTAVLYLGAATMMLATTGLAFLLHRIMPHANLSLLFLTGILIVAAGAGLGPSLLASVLSFLAFNYFFTKPYYTLQVADDGDVATLAFFVLIAAITGSLAARMHREIRQRMASLQRMSRLYVFIRQMSSTADTGTALEILAEHLNSALGCGISALVSESGNAPEIRARAGQPTELSATGIESAWSRQSDTLFESGPWTFIPLGTSRGRVGLVAIEGHLDAGQADSARSMCEQAGVVIDRTQLSKDLEETRVIYETEQLRSALLSSVSHDLRTPLASIIGAATSLLEYGESFSSQDRRELLQTVVEESQRLDRHIQNLLDMTRIGKGGLKLRRDWVDLHDMVSSALSRLRGELKDIQVDIVMSPQLPLVWVHGVLIEQALVNLLDNAIRFSPGGGRVSISARASGDTVEIDVCDQGPGIPESEREVIFDMFYTARQGDRGKNQGTGLGLTICRGMIGAHQGSITALPGPEGCGTCMRIILPIGEKDEIEAHE